MYLEELLIFFTYCVAKKYRIKYIYLKKKEI